MKRRKGEEGWREERGERAGGKGRKKEMPEKGRYDANIDNDVRTRYNSFAISIIIRSSVKCTSEVSAPATTSVCVCLSAL